MTIQEWLDYAKANRNSLNSLINDWHPRSKKLYHDMKITAPNAQQACNIVSNVIRNKDKDKPNPIELFNSSLDKDDWSTCRNILNETWFGVPESTSCWGITGFSEAIRLIEDTPEVEEV